MNYIPDLSDHAPTLPPEAEPALSDARKAKLKGEIEQLIDDEFERLKEYAADYISGVATGRAKRFLEKVLDGDDDAAMELLGSANDSDRYKTLGIDEGEPWAKVYHGTLFETGGIALRRKIVDAHAELLKNERIKDLESVVEGLRRQVNKLEADIERRRYQ